MMNYKILQVIVCCLFLSGCFAETMTLVHSGIGASQGRIIQSAVSPALSLSVKQTTGKFPLEHVIERERQRLAKKSNELEQKFLEKAEKGLKLSKEKVLPIKNSVNNQITKINSNILKIRSFAKDNFRHNPRYSYKSR
jgi:hypothetical protein